MPPKKNNKNVRPTRRANSPKKNKENVKVATKGNASKSTSKAKESNVKNKEKSNVSNKSMEMNLTLVWNKNDEALENRPKPVKNKKKTTTLTKKLEEKKEIKGKTKQHAVKEVKTKTPRETRSTAVSGIRKRSMTDESAEESNAKKLLKTCKQTQVTPSMIDEEGFEFKKQTLNKIKDEQIKPESNENEIHTEQGTREFAFESDEIGKNNSRDQTTEIPIDEGRNVDLDDVIIIISSDEDGESDSEEQKTIVGSEEQKTKKNPNQ